MNVIQRIEHWGDTHHPTWMDGVRIVLGILLFLKGVSFISDTDQLMGLVGSAKFNVMSALLVHYVAFAHLVGGLLITFGCLTRLAVLAQLPILIGAVFFVNLTQGLSTLNSELWLSLITLIMLLVILVMGSGKFSVDESMKHDRK